MINIKLFKNGSFQMTWCKCYFDAKISIVSIWKAIKNILNLDDKNFQVYIVSALRKINFKLGFEVDREARSTIFCPNYILLQLC